MGKDDFRPQAGAAPALPAYGPSGEDERRARASALFRDGESMSADRTRDIAGASGTMSAAFAGGDKIDLAQVLPREALDGGSQPIVSETPRHVDGTSRTCALTEFNAFLESWSSTAPSQALSSGDYQAPQAIMRTHGEGETGLQDGPETAVPKGAQGDFSGPWQDSAHRASVATEGFSGTGDALDASGVTCAHANLGFSIAGSPLGTSREERSKGTPSQDAWRRKTMELGESWSALSDDPWDACVQSDDFGPWSGAAFRSQQSAGEFMGHEDALEKAGVSESQRNMEFIGEDERSSSVRDPTVPRGTTSSSAAKKLALASLAGGRAAAKRLAGAELRKLDDEGSDVGAAADASLRGYRLAKAARSGASSAAAAFGLEALDELEREGGSVGEAVALARKTKGAVRTATKLVRVVKGSSGTRLLRRRDRLLTKRMQDKSRAIARAVKSGRTIEGMGAAARAKAVMVSAQQGAAGHGAGTAAIAMAAPSPVFLLVIGLAVMMVLFGAATSAAMPKGGNLSDVESRVASFFLGKGLDEAHTAAIMGNMAAESGMDPAKREVGGPGIGLCQWSYGRADGLRSFAASRGVDWTDLDCQLDFFWEADIWAHGWSGSYTVSASSDDPPGGTRVSGSKSGFMAAKGVEEATRQFCYGWERPGIPRISRRIERAREYLSSLTMTGGQDYADATARQKAVVDATKRVGCPGPGLCAAWVNRVFSAAGMSPQGSLPYASSYMRWCPARLSADALKVGMIVVVPSTSSSPGIGHIGIYVGGGQIMSSETSGGRGYLKSRPVKKWCDIFCTVSPAYMGWINGVDLSK